MAVNMVNIREIYMYTMIFPTSKYKPSDGERMQYLSPSTVPYVLSEHIIIITLSANIESTRIQTHIIYDRSFCVA